MTDPPTRAIARCNAEEYRDALLAFEARWPAERSDVLRACIKRSNALNRLRLGLVASPRRLLASAEPLLADRSEPYEGPDLGAARARVTNGLEMRAGGVRWDTAPWLRIERAGGASGGES